MDKSADAWVFVCAVTVTVKLHILLLPQMSEAVLSTVVAPIGNALPLGGVETMFNELQPPLAVTL